MREKIISLQTKLQFKQMTPSRVAFLGVYLGIMLSLKYLLGFVPGIELITFMFVIAGIFIPFVDGLILITSFNLSMIALYGWGTWQMMYWVIWPFDLITSKILSKVTKNVYVLSSWGFMCGFLIWFWYFISDTIFYGRSYATLNIISAIPINLIEGMVTSMVIVTTLPGLSKVFDINANRLWGKEKPYGFKGVYTKRKIMIIIAINVVFAAGIILLFAFNQEFLDLKESMMEHKRATKI